MKSPRPPLLPGGYSETTVSELGLETFGDVTDGPDGQPLHQAQVIRNLVEEGVLAAIEPSGGVLRRSGYQDFTTRTTP